MIFDGLRDETIPLLSMGYVRRASETEFYIISKYFLAWSPPKPATSCKNLPNKKGFEVKFLKIIRLVQGR